MRLPRDNAHHKKSLRLLQTRELLQTKPYTASELAKVLNVDKRTALRYLEDLGAVDVAGGGKPQYQLLEERELSPIEALVTHTALRMLYHHSPGYNPVYFSALHKLARRLLEPAQSIALKSTEDLEKRKYATWGEGEALAQVAEAWFKRRVLEFDYLSAGGSGKLRSNALEVYFLEVARTNLAVYVIGFERSFHRALRTYKLSRMRNLRFASEEGAYTIPASFDPRAYLSNAWGVIGASGGEPVEVKLRFKREAAYRIKEGGYPHLHITQHHPDGGLEVRIIAGTDKENFPLEILSWVQSWGPRVEVLEPQSLRERWLSEAKQVLSEYGGEGHD